MGDPSTSPITSPTGFHLFGQLKEALHLEHFQSNQDVQIMCKTDQPKEMDARDRSIQKLEERWKKWLESMFKSKQSFVLIKKLIRFAATPIYVVI